MMIRNVTCVLAAFAFMLLGASVVHAEPPPPPPSPEHDAAFRSGLDQYAQGNNMGAIATWESLLETLGEERAFKVLYNLGLAYQAVGDVTRAIERYEAFVRQANLHKDVMNSAAESALAERAADAQSRLDQLKQAHGALNVHAPVRGGLVLTRIGTSEPRAAGYRIWLAPGPHDIEIFVGTDHLKRMHVDVEQGKTIDIDTSPPEEPPPPPPPPQKAPLPQSSTWIWIGGGATLASVALPVSLFVVASNKKDDATALGTGHSGYADARSSFNTWRTLSYVSYALPAAFATLTVLYVVLRSTRTSADANTNASIGVGPSSLLLRGAF